MALEACSFQVSTIVASTAAATSRVRLLHGQKPFPQKEKHNLLTISGSRRAISVGGGNGRRTQVVCQAKNVVDEGNPFFGGKRRELEQLGDRLRKSGPGRVLGPVVRPVQDDRPVIDELAKDYAGKIVCCKVNTDDCPNIASNYGIRSIPTVLMFKNGEKKESVIGAVPKSTLSGIIDKYMEM
uniref:Thioredoxin domain-containing protein n=1 Tax=Ananas comosus var. bracteatus TaxID=296719 RepID=A0A6V7QG03_ANACO|nr:unnamed protein product [Ananas comosus var. bracteatus]